MRTDRSLSGKSEGRVYDRKKRLSPFAPTPAPQGKPAVLLQCEPALITGWICLMRGYAGRQDRMLNEGVVAVSTTWAEPLRDVALPRSLALRQLVEGAGIQCGLAAGGSKQARSTSTTICPGQHGRAPTCGPHVGAVERQATRFWLGCYLATSCW